MALTERQRQKIMTEKADSYEDAIRDLKADRHLAGSARAREAVDRLIAHYEGMLSDMCC